MKLPHDSFKMPSDDTVIWRYMDVTKFLSLVMTKELYFPNLTELEDTYEGIHPGFGTQMQEFFDTIGRVYVQHGLDQLAKTFPAMPEQMVQTLKDGPPETIERMWTEFGEGRVGRLLNLVLKLGRSCFIVSCWHRNKNQSAAMWKLYAKSDEAVAIKSTFGRVKAALGVIHETMFAAKVVYYDDQPKPTSFTLPSFCFQKRRSFAHEAEIRFVLNNATGHELDNITAISTSLTDPFDARELFDRLEKIDLNVSVSGRSLPVCLETLIKDVYVAPTCKPWIKKSLDLLLAEIGPKRVVIQSDLYNDPLE
jgi:hypothetical protein